jgi:ketosteroid isomerase-like protein
MKRLAFLPWLVAREELMSTNPVRQRIRHRDRPRRSLDEHIPNVEWHGTIGGLDEGSVRRGHQAVMRGFDEYYAAWERLDLRPEEIIDTGEELVVFVHEVARGRHSGVVVETDTATISTFREGMVVRVRGFMDQQKALEAARLPGRPQSSARRSAGSDRS